MTKFVDYLDSDEIQSNLAEAHNHLLECISLLRGTLTQDRQLIATLEMALGHDHQWLGGKYDETIEDLMREAEQMKGLDAEMRKTMQEEYPEE